jgi:hypothetical protein
MGWWYELRGSNGSLVMFGTSYATQEAAIRAAEIVKKRMRKRRADMRIETGFMAPQLQRQDTKPVAVNEKLFSSVAVISVESVIFAWMGSPSTGEESEYKANMLPSAYVRPFLPRHHPR